jgi:hypothetical protein
MNELGRRGVTKERALETPGRNVKSVSTGVVTTNSKANVEHGRIDAGAAKREEERKAAIDAKAILDRLTPSSARSEPIVFGLRSAANLARKETLTRLESRAALDRLHDEAAMSLYAVCRLLDKAQLTQETLEQARRAVSAWLNALTPERA